MKKRTTQRTADHSLLQGEQRINKILAAAGLGSRRQVDELIEQGRVEVDGKAIKQVGVKINPETATITVDGELLRKHRPVYFALHKPEGVLCTNRDPQGRTRVVDMVPNQFRLFPVGRLDASSTGLILLTNDGELAQRLTHPRHGVPKRYAVTVVGQVEPDSLRRLQRGIHLAEGRARVDHAKLKRIRKGCTELEITLSEGKNREIRRVLARLGHKVVSLKRIGIGPLKLGELPEGAYRQLGMSEVESLYHAVEAIKRARKQERKERRKPAEETSTKPISKKAPRSKAKGQRAFDEHISEEHEFEEHELEELDFEEQLDNEEASKSESEEGILIRDSEMDSGLTEDWGPPASQRLGAVIGEEEFAPEKKSTRTRAKQGRPRNRDTRESEARKSRSEKPRGGKPGSGSPRSRSNASQSRPSRTEPTRKQRGERPRTRGGEGESLLGQERPKRSKKGIKGLRSASKPKSRPFSTKKSKRRGK